MDKLKELKAKYQQIAVDMRAIVDNAENSLTDEQQAEFDNLRSESESVKKQIDNLETSLKMQADADSMANRPAPAKSPVVKPDSVVMDDPAAGPTLSDNTIKVPAIASRFAGNLRSFAGADAELKAYKAGMWFRAINGNPNAQQFCKDHGMPVVYEGVNHQGGINTDGGYLVPDELDTDIIRLVESRGVFRQKARRVPMAGDTKTRNRRTSGVTGYFVGEGSAGTESKKGWDQISLVAKKLMVLTSITNELNSDAIINVADDIVSEIAYAFADKEDECGFNGTGTSTYGGIVGVISKLSTLNGVDDGGGLVLGAGNLFSEITLANHLKMIGTAQQVAGAMFEWYCSQTYFATVMQRLEVGGGGNTIGTTKDGARQLLHLGYPVNIVNVMPKTDANSQIACLYGDMRAAADFGDRAGMTLAFSENAVINSVSMFETDQIGVRGTERFDINAHDLGTASAAGPLVGLITAAS